MMHQLKPSLWCWNYACNYRKGFRCLLVVVDLHVYHPVPLSSLENSIFHWILWKHWAIPPWFLDTVNEKLEYHLWKYKQEV
jgi:hypothetical protein